MRTHAGAAIVTAHGATILPPSGGEPVTVGSDHPNWAAIKHAIQKGMYEVAADLGDLHHTVEAWLAGRLDLSASGLLKLDGRALPSSITEVALRLIRQGSPVEPLANFITRLYRNEEARSVEGLLRFVEKYGLPLFADGTFLCYKGLRADWRDRQTGTVQYEVGARVSMPRDRIDPDPDKACAPGLHVGSWEYAANWAGGVGGVIVACQVAPEDVVRVPHDHDYAKVATSSLLVMGEITAPRESGQVYGADLQPERYDSRGASVRVDLEEEDWDENLED